MHLTIQRPKVSKEIDDFQTLDIILNKLQRNKQHRANLHNQEQTDKLELAPLSPLVLKSSPLTRKWVDRNYRHSLNNAMIPEKIRTQFENMRINTDVPDAFKHKDL